MSLVDESYTGKGTVVEPFSCLLTQTDVESNKNKYYIMQIVEENPSSFCMVIRYGRVGEFGKPSQDFYQNRNDAVDFFKKQFKSKTGNNFGDAFVKKAGKYHLTETEKPKDVDIKKTDDDKALKQADLDDQIETRLKFFLDLISNIKMLSDTLIQHNLDQKKMPLGKISNAQLDSATALLKTLRTVVSANPIDTAEVTKLTSEFYTLVPHSFGRRKPPLLDDVTVIDKCSDLIDELKNVHVTYNIIKNSNNLNRLTNVYNQMNASIASLDKTKRMYTELVKYVANTHAPTHYCKLEVVDIYEVSKGTDPIYDNYTKDMKNKMLLIHGSPVVNWCSIIKNGLLLDPSKLGVRIAGKMFGYGLYFANAISKSFNYCSADVTNNTAVLAIAEVALGEIYEQYQSDSSLSQKYLDSKGKNSTHGKGGSSPESVTVIDGVGIPNGKLVKHNDPSKNYSLLYDEFIIYNTSQYKIKYLIVVQNKK